MKISYVHGICVNNDAISNSIRDEITWLTGAGHDVRLYAYACDHPQLPFQKVENVADIAFDAHFQSSDLVVFHFGVFYALFDAIVIAPKTARRLVVFHNITPKEFVPVEHHETIDKSFHQLANIGFADHVVCVSQTNLDVLREAGIRTPATVLPLALHSQAHPPSDKPGMRDGVLRVAFLGRFVRSKGPDELLRALDSVLASHPALRVHVQMMGNLAFSYSTLVDELRAAIADLDRQYGARVRVDIHGNVTEEQKQSVLREADLFVLPSYHEGFCVPILEAMASGCQVVSYANSNIPAICAGLARLVPSGDVAALARAIGEAADQVGSSDWRAPDGGYSRYAATAMAYVDGFSPERARRRFLHFFKNLVY